MIFNLPDTLEIKENLPLCRYSSFKIGGPADYAVFPRTINEFTETVDRLQSGNVRFDVVGNASNILFDDNGYRGALIFTHKMCNAKVYAYDERYVANVECGKKLTELSFETLKKHNLKGLEFAYGIPGSVGGAVYMNAGAYGSQMSDIVSESLCYDAKEKKIFALDFDGHNFSYRHSFFQDNKNVFVLSVKLNLFLDVNGSALKVALDNMQSRKEKQPLEYPNAGSTFKRPEGYIAAKLIDDQGLKGYSVGGAEVSSKHAGFIVNKGDAKSADVLKLMEIVSDRIKDAYGIRLTPEIIYIPEK